MFKLEQLPKEKIAWLAGLFQAEAYFYIDTRQRSKIQDPSYTPPPPLPCIKLHMVEQDLMEHVADLLEQEVAPQARLTTAEKKVYRINLSARAKVEAFLKAILPYIVGEKNREKILKHLAVCEEYNQWVAAGGRKQAARHAATIKAQKAKQNPK